MFYCRVRIGNCIELPPNKNLLLPPKGYVSVKGFTNDSYFFMVYANKKVYPEYLITY